jgi:adenine deaminase
MNDPVGSAGPVAPESVGAVDALMRTLLPVARGEAPADLVIRNARVANVLSLEYEEADVAVAGGFVVGLGRYEGREVVDAEGQVLIPGMIDGHVHIESSLTTPARFAEVVVPRGTAAVMADPHEIANVWGAPGVRALRDASEGLPLDVFLGAPSCVPASPLETCREPLEASDLEGLFRDGTCSHLGEMMNFTGLIGGDEGVWARVAASGSRPRTAHLPGLRGRELCAYALSGCDGDHETTGLEEAREKLRRGVWIMMREGAASPDLEALAPLVRENPARSSRCLAVSDDVSPTHLRERGHMDHKVRRLCALGVEPLAALRMVTLTPAEYFRLPRRGAVAPGRIADLVLVDSLQTCRVDRVWKGGRLVARGGRLLVPLPLRPFPRIPSPPLPPLSPDRIAPPVRRVRRSGSSGPGRAPC